MKRSTVTTLILSFLIIPASAVAQDAVASVVRLIPSTEQLTVAIGARTPFSVRAVDAVGNDVDVPLRVIGPRNAVRVAKSGQEDCRGGTFRGVVYVSSQNRGDLSA